MASVPSVSALCKEMKSDVGQTMHQYNEKFADSQPASCAWPGRYGDEVQVTSTDRKDVDKEKVVNERFQQAEKVTATFYNLVTDFYEYGWGQSFHFAPIYDGKSYAQCIADYERECGKMLGAKPGMKILVSAI